jgi:DNA-directed RNA polymerase subunit RPC12/RpoP
LKCRECGNTFQSEEPKSGTILVCPVCDAGYKVSVKDGKIVLEDFMYENENLEL